MTKKAPAPSHPTAWALREDGGYLQEKLWLYRWMPLSKYLTVRFKTVLRSSVATPFICGDATYVGQELDTASFYAQREIQQVGVAGFSDLPKLDIQTKKSKGISMTHPLGFEYDELPDFVQECRARGVQLAPEEKPFATSRRRY